MSQTMGAPYLPRSLRQIWDSKILDRQCRDHARYTKDCLDFEEKDTGELREPGAPDSAQKQRVTITQLCPQATNLPNHVLSLYRSKRL